MDNKLAINMLETGEAVCLYTTVLLMKAGDCVYVSFNGEEWSEIDSQMIRSQFES